MGRQSATDRPFEMADSVVRVFRTLVHVSARWLEGTWVEVAVGHRSRDANNGDLLGCRPEMLPHNDKAAIGRSATPTVCRAGRPPRPSGRRGRHLRVSPRGQRGRHRALRAAKHRELLPVVMGWCEVLDRTRALCVRSAGGQSCATRASYLLRRRARSSGHCRGQ